MQIDNLIANYIKLTKQHKLLEPIDNKQVQKANKIAAKIIETADTIYENEGIAEFEKLLDHQSVEVRNWAAFNLIERMNPTKEQIEKALEVIEKLAKSDTIDAPGAVLWLQNWKTK